MHQLISYGAWNVTCALFRSCDNVVQKIRAQVRLGDNKTFNCRLVRLLQDMQAAHACIIFLHLRTHRISIKQPYKVFLQHECKRQQSTHRHLLVSYHHHHHDHHHDHHHHHFKQLFARHRNPASNSVCTHMRRSERVQSQRALPWP